MSNSFSFNLTDFIHFESYLNHPLFSNPFSEFSSKWPDANSNILRPYSIYLNSVLWQFLSVTRFNVSKGIIVSFSVELLACIKDDT